MNLLKLGIKTEYTLKTSDQTVTPYGGHVRVHIFMWPISAELTKSLGIKTEYMLRTVVRLVNIFQYLIVLNRIGRSKMIERFHDMTPNRMFFNVKCIAKEKNIKKRYDKHLILV